jgi:uncharacterized protein DUF5335
MKIKQTPKDEWSKFFDVFSRQHEGWLVKLEILGTEIGAQNQERELAFGGIVDEWDETHGNRIVIMVGEKPDEHVTHSIAGPTEVNVEEVNEGAPAMLAIKSADGVMALMRFRSPILRK